MSQPSKGSQRRGKKKCDRGKNCPYKDEYQHKLEFYHTEEDNDQSRDIDRFIPFQGKGNAISKVNKKNSIEGYCSNSSNSFNINQINKNKTILRNQRVKVFTTKNSTIKHKNNSSIQSMPNNTIQFKKVNSRKKSSQLTSSRSHVKKVENTIIDLIDDDDEIYVKKTTTSQTSQTTKKKDGGVKTHIGIQSQKINQQVKTNRNQQNVKGGSQVVDLCCDNSDDDDDIVLVKKNDARNMSSLHRKRTLDQDFRQPMNPKKMHKKRKDNDMITEIMKHRQPINQKFQSTLRSRNIRSSRNSMNNTREMMNSLTHTHNSNAYPIFDISNSVAQMEQKEISKAIIESNRQLKEEQDNEYYESLIKDEAKERKQKQIELDEKQHLEEKIKKTKDDQIAKQYRKQMNNKQLSSEPPENTPNTVLLAFRLPRICKTTRVSRRFHVTSKVDQIFFFLNGHEEMSTVKRWKLFKVFGGQEISKFCNETLKNLGLSSKEVLVVRDEDS